LNTENHKLIKKLKQNLKTKRRNNVNVPTINKFNLKIKFFKFKIFVLIKRVFNLKKTKGSNNSKFIEKKTNFSSTHSELEVATCNLMM
jgi:hypothetical protein